MRHKKVTYPIQDRWSFLWLAIGLALQLVSVPLGRMGIPLAFWLGTIFFIRFMRCQRRWWLAYLILALTMGAATYLVMPAALEGFRLSGTIGAAIGVNLLLVADRLLAPRLPGFTATLVFPLGYTAMEFINTVTNPIGSIGVTAYTQAGNLALMQLTAITGLWGVSFLIAWLAPIVNWAWERSFAWSAIRGGVAVYAGILLLVLGFGQARLAFSPPPADTVRVAGIVAVDYLEDLDALNQAMAEDWRAFREMANARPPVYLEQTVREARAGAKIVVWPEMAAPVAEEDEGDLVAQAQGVARQEGIYLVMPMLVRNQEDRPYENKLLVLDPAGQIVMEHFKYGGRGMEGNRLQGDGVLQTVETPFGTLSAIICWDTDFPNTVLQAGKNGTDILVSPSLEFRELDPTHAHMAMARAIENGVSVVRVADNGLSVAYDPYGRSLAAVDHFTGGERVLLAQVPTAGVKTLYPIIGDLFGWLAAAGFLSLIVIGVVRGGRLEVAEAPLSEEELAAVH